jgi:Sulfotransferase domain
MAVVNILGRFAEKVLFRRPPETSGRRGHVYCIGTAKSGTHSIADMFCKNVRTGHEPQSAPLIEKIFGVASGQVSKEQLSRWVRERDREMALEVDSSQLNFFLLDVLLAEFPDARFVLTIRDAYSWVDSFINHVLHFNQAGKDWLRLRDFRFGSGAFTHQPEEQILKEKGLHTVDGYLSYWAMHNHNVLAQVPAHRLLVVRTQQIRQRAYEIADFAGLPRSCVDLSRTHSFKNPEKFNLLHQVDRRFLEDKMEKHCGRLMRRFFPEINSLEDANL